MIYDITPFSTLDYPEQLSCIVWLAGCNLRCKYCYNADIVYAKSANYDYFDLERFLLSRRGLLDGVVFSGGESTCAPNLIRYIHLAKELGFLVKIDSNATKPDFIKKLLDLKLVDYFAIDFKAPEHKYKEITGFDKFYEFCKSLEYLVQSGVEFELRCTWHYDLLSLDEIKTMQRFAKERGYKNKFYLQKFQDLPNIGSLHASCQTPDLSSLGDDFCLRAF